MIVNVHDVNYDDFEKLTILKRKKGSKRKEYYYNAVCAFDIETTNIDEIKQNVMYIWQFQFDEHYTVVGRYWDEFRFFTQKLNSILTNGKLVIYVHNLSYEWQYLKSVLPVTSVFAMSERKVLKFVSNSLEFRCSLLQTNMSLMQFTKRMDVKHKKLEDFDYHEKRWSWTEINSHDLEYAVNDVLGLVEGIKKEMFMDGDDLYTIPLTSTGYARRTAKQSLGGFHQYIKDMLPDLEVFDMLRKCFRGGNTHANRYNANMLLTNVTSYDISSSYPSVLLNREYPTKFSKADPKQFDYYYFKRKKCCLVKIVLWDVKLSNELWGCPYLAYHKCYNVINPELDNGRILACDNCYTYMTEVDLNILFSEYTFNYRIDELYIAGKRRLPINFRARLFEIYRQKTSLKGTDDYAYGKVKSLFNSYYGMMVQNPCKPTYQYDGIGLSFDDEVDESKLIEEYHKSGWLPYQWGVYCTCYAREVLERGMSLIDPSDFVYCDTDSIKFMGNYDDAFKRLNEELINYNYVAFDKKGKAHYIGIFEYDGFYTKFKTLGAKKYAYNDIDGSFHITVAGVGKKSGALEMGDIKYFNEGYVFKKAGGTEAIYNDIPPVDKWVIDGHEIDIISNIAIYDSEYTLGLTLDYKRLINSLFNTDIETDLYMNQS